MASSDAFGDWLLEYEDLTAELAPLLARYATGGTNFDRKAVLVAKLQEEYRQQLRNEGDSKPSAAKIDQLVHSDARFLSFIDETEASREKLFRLSAQRQAILFKIRRAIRSAPEDADEVDNEDGR